MISLTDFRKVLATPTDPSSLAFFRIAFGLLMLIDVLIYFTPGWIHYFFIASPFHFAYEGLGWIKPLPGVGMYVLFGLLALASILVLLGWFYRVAMTGFFLGFSYLFLIDKTLYLNHNYLICLLALLMIGMPANACWSLDARRKPSLGQAWIPFWPLFMLRAQLAIVYVYGAIAKLNADWLQGEPVRLWLFERRHLPVIGDFLTTEAAVFFVAYGGIVFDALIVPILLYRKTRWIGVGLSVFFHLSNHWLFDIGIFPWMMLGATFLFFPPDWPRRWIPRKSPVPEPPPAFRLARSLPALLIMYLAIQFALPLRHHLYPGDVQWTEEGHRFSWRMKLRDKQGWSWFRVVVPNSDTLIRLDPAQVLTPRQADRMSTRPDMIRQFAEYLADRTEAELGQRPRVYAEAWTSLNGREPALLIDPDTDLANVRPTLRSSRWIKPLDDRKPRSRLDVGELGNILPLRHLPPFQPELVGPVLDRMRETKAEQLRRIHDELLAGFGIESEGYYYLHEEAGILYELIPLRAGGVFHADVDDLSDHFRTRPLHRGLSRERQADYSRLAARKQDLMDTLAVLDSLSETSR